MRGPTTSLALVSSCLALLLAPGPAAGGATLELLGQINPGPAFLKSDVWGWVDPVTQKEYAILGTWFDRKVYIIDVTDPTAPWLRKTISDAPGFDLKTWGQYLYLVDGSGGATSGSIYDLSNLALPMYRGGFPSAHNIFIDDSGYLYGEVIGVNIYDLNADPESPALLWSGGIEGHDATVVGDLLYDFHGSSGTFLYDVANRASPTLLGSITGFGINYHHHGWPTADGNHLFVADELATNPFPDISVFDIRNPASPARVDVYNDPTATIHNAYRVGDYLYTSYYSAGFRVFDVSDPTNMQVVAEYDTSPTTGEGFTGAWGCYPFAPSGNVYVSDQDGGLFIFRFTPDVTGTPESRPERFALHQNAPNPVRDRTAFRFSLREAGPVSLAIYNLLGQRVRSLVKGPRPAGTHTVAWDGRDERRRPVAAGTYYYRLEAGFGHDTKSLVVVR